MKGIFDLLNTCLAVLIFAYIILWDIARAVYFFKCVGVKKCSNKKCFAKDTCRKYASVWTEEDIEKLHKLIDSLDESCE